MSLQTLNSILLSDLACLLETRLLRHSLLEGSPSVKWPMFLQRLSNFPTTPLFSTFRQAALQHLSLAISIWSAVLWLVLLQAELFPSRPHSKSLPAWWTIACFCQREHHLLYDPSLDILCESTTSSLVIDWIIQLSNLVYSQILLLIDCISLVHFDCSVCVSMYLVCNRPVYSLLSEWLNEKLGCISLSSYFKHFILVLIVTFLYLREFSTFIQWILIIYLFPSSLPPLKCPTTRSSQKWKGVEPSARIQEYTSGTHHIKKIPPPQLLSAVRNSPGREDS